MTWLVRNRLGVALLVAALPFACDGGGGGGPTGDGGGNGGPQPPSPPASGTITVTLTNQLRFVPDDARISVGSTIRWVRNSTEFHTVTPEGHSEWARQPMDEDGQVFEHTFDTAGTFPYFCEPHRADGMVGTITVVQQ